MAPNVADLGTVDIIRVESLSDSIPVPACSDTVIATLYSETRYARTCWEQTAPIAR